MNYVQSHFQLLIGSRNETIMQQASCRLAASKTNLNKGFILQNNCHFTKLRGSLLTETNTKVYFGACLISHFVSKEGISPGVNRPGRHSNQLCILDTEVKMRGTVTPRAL